MDLSALCPPHRVVARYLEAVSRPRGPAKGWETRKENDDFAKMNIPEKYHLLWEKTKRQFKGNPDQRAEQFMEWVEGGRDLGENRDSLGEGELENIYLMDAEAERLTKEYEKQQKKEQKCRERCPSCYRDENDNLEEAPFLQRPERDGALFVEGEDVARLDRDVPGSVVLVGVLPSDVALVGLPHGLEPAVTDDVARPSKLLLDFEHLGSVAEVAVVQAVEPVGQGSEDFVREFDGCHGPTRRGVGHDQIPSFT